MLNKILMKLSSVLAFTILIVSCSKDLPPGDYDANEVGKIKKVIPGIVISKRAVHLHKSNADGLSAKPGSDGFIEGGYNQTRGVEYVVKLGSGGIISVVQGEDLKLKNKQKVLVIYGRNTRVVADNGSDAY
jgi:outer membrane lipoprotein SlyB